MGIDNGIQRHVFAAQDRVYRWLAPALLKSKAVSPRLLSQADGRVTFVLETKVTKNSFKTYGQAAGMTRRTGLTETPLLPSLQLGPVPVGALAGARSRPHLNEPASTGLNPPDLLRKSAVYEQSCNDELRVTPRASGIAQPSDRSIGC